MKKMLLGLAAAVSLSSGVTAQTLSGFYIGLGAGANLLPKTDASFSGPAAAQMSRSERSGTVLFDPGLAGVLSLGYGFGNGVRVEVEGSYRENQIDTAAGFRGVAPAGSSTDGRFRSYGVMANLLYDFSLGEGVPVVPYVGFGAGYAWLEFDKIRASMRGTELVMIDGQDGRFAYQGILGAALPLDHVAPGLAVTAEYRMFGTLSSEADVSRVLGRSVDASVNVDPVYNHSLLVGIRYAFNAAPAPVAAAPAPVAPAAAPVPARTFLVFFDFDRADLTDRARAIIAEAAQNASRVGVTRIEVAGHADRSGTPAYNQRLSERRAQAVAAELERRGVARSAMAIQAFGESRPLVPTDDGAREPQNRRVEIVLR